MKAVFLSGLQSLYSGSLRPGTVFASENPPTPRPVLFALAAIGFISALFLFLTGLINAGDLQIAQDRLDQYIIVRGAALSIFQVPSPPARFLFPVYWALYVVYAAVARHLVTVVFGETDRSLIKMLVITMVAVFPIIVIAAAQGVINNLFPMIPPISDLAVLWSRVILSAVLFLASFCWEGFICVTAFRRQFGQNIGRAVLTWLSPAAFFMALFYGLLAIARG